MDTRSKNLTICGRTVIVRPFRFFDLEKIARIQDDPAQVYVVLALAVRMDPDEFCKEFGEMDVFEAAALDAAIREVNADFFTRKLATAAPPPA